MSQLMWVTRLAVKVLGQTMGLRRAVLIILVLVITTTIEVVRPFVFVWAAVLSTEH